MRTGPGRRRCVGGGERARGSPADELVVANVLEEARQTRSSPAICADVVWVQEKARRGELQVRRVPTEENPAGILTKFVERVPTLGIWPGLGCRGRRGLRR